MELGDAIESVLETIGITKELIQYWLGDCCCEERKLRLNQLSIMARRFVRGKLSRQELEEHLNGNRD